MAENIKIAIIGDFNFTYNAHHATNLALEHSERFLEVDVNYYWIRLSEAVNMRPQAYHTYDGVWIAPGPFTNEFFLAGIISNILHAKVPTLLTGESFKVFVELLVKQNNLNPNDEKLISDNLVSGTQFEPVQISPHSSEMQKLYATHSTIELTSSRYSLYPQLITALNKDVLIAEAYNQFEEPEIMRLINHPYAIATMFCPQISSTRDMPHPLVNSFIRSCMSELKSVETSL
jgi:CTP synthase (UTP-ammonia lyase)